MRIGYVISKYPAVSHTFIRSEVVELRKQGIEVETFSIRSPTESELKSEQDIEEKSRTAYILPASLVRLVASLSAELISRPFSYFSTLCFALTHRSPGLKSFAWSLFYFAEAMLLTRLLRKKNVTRLHSHFVNSAGEVALLASKHIGIPYSFTIHGLSDFGNPALNRLAEKIATADFVVCVSEYGKSQAMLVSQPEHWNKIHVVRCGLDESFRAVDQSFRKQDPCIRLLIVGRLSPEKGHRGLLQAVVKAKASGVPVRLSVIGDGNERDSIERQISNLNLKDEVELLGSRSSLEVRDALRKTDVCVLASLMEGLPVTLLESFSQGVPVIAPRVAGIPELVVESENGWLFTPGNWEDLASCIKKAFEERSMLAELGERGRKRCLEEYSICQNINVLRTLFSATH